MTGELAMAIDDEQLLEVFDRALAEVYGYLLHRCRAKFLAEDLTSETFLGALDSIRRGYAEEVTVAWLIGIARHKLADHWRREEREQRHLATVAAEPAGLGREIQVEPELGIEVLAQLSSSHRAALVLRHVDGLSVPEVATLLGRSVHATETLLVPGAGDLPCPVPRSKGGSSMSDELDVLRHEHAVIEPDQRFRAELMDRLRRDLASRPDRAPIPLTSSTPAPETAAQDALRPPVQIELAASDGLRRHGRRWLAAAAAVFIAAVSVAVIQDRDRDSKLEAASDPTQVFTDIRPGSTVLLPPPPVPEARPGERMPSALVWSGSELIRWSGLDFATVGNGAAFDLASGTWRTIARAPIEFRPFATTTWTGTEMFVWGGQVDDAQGQPTSAVDGAAYNPTTDTWRRLPDAPIEGAQGCCALWTGEEVIVLGAGPDPYELDAGGHPGSPGQQAAGYDPETDEWRRLADSPGPPEGDTFWTGETVLSMVRMDPEATDEPLSLLRYDLSNDEWQVVDEDASYSSLIPVSDGEGQVRTVLALPTQTGAPVAVLDRVGNASEPCRVRRSATRSLWSARGWARRRCSGSAAAARRSAPKSCGP